MSPDQLGSYARVYAWSLAHGHPRSADSLAINAYFGSGSVFDKAWCRFAVAYADRNEKDYQVRVTTPSGAADGRIEATAG